MPDQMPEAQQSASSGSAPSPRPPQLRVWLLHIVEQPHRTRLQNELREALRYVHLTLIRFLRLNALLRRGDECVTQEMVDDAFPEAWNAMGVAETTALEIQHEEAVIFGREPRRPGDWPEELREIAQPEQVLDDSGWANWPGVEPTEEEIRQAQARGQGQGQGQGQDQTPAQGQREGQ